MSYPMGSVAVKEKQPSANAAGSMKIVRASGAFFSEGQIAPVEAKPVLSPVKGKEERQQASNPFTREKKEQPAQLPPDNWIG